VMSLAPCTERSMARATSVAARPNGSPLPLMERARNITGRRSEDIIVSISPESSAINWNDGKAM